MFGKHRLGVRMRYDTWGVQSLKSLLFNRIMTNCLYICSRSAWDESSPNEAHKCALPAFTKNTIFWNIDYKNFINKVVLQASEGCDYTFLKCMWYKSLCIDKPSMSINHLDVMCKRCLPRKARSHGKVYIKRIMLYCWIYVHAPREITAHLTRCAQAHPTDVH